MPKIDTLDLQGCRLGTVSILIKDFGLALGAETVVSTNQYHEFGLKRFVVAKGHDEELARQFSEFGDYLVDPSLRGWIAMARGKTIDRIFLVEWFVGSWADHERNLPEDEKDRRENFHPTSALQPRYIGSKEDLAKVKAEAEPKDPTSNYDRPCRISKALKPAR